MLKVAFTGEILVDLVRLAEDTRPRLSITGVAGGSAFNSASICAALGVATRFFGEVGQDALGDWLIDVAQGRGIDTSFIGRRSEFKTSLALAVIDDQGNASYDFYRNFNQTQFLPNLQGLQDIQWFHFGSMSSFDDRNFDAVQALAKIAYQSGAVVSFDPNLRRGVTPDFKVRFEAYKPYISLLKLSIEDSKHFFGEPSLTQQQALERLAALNIPLVMLTLGDQGAIILRQGKTSHIPAFKVDVVDTIGAGDTFTAGLVYEFSKQGVVNAQQLLDIDDAALHRVTARAVELSALACTVRGAGVPKTILDDWR